MKRNILIFSIFCCIAFVSLPEDAFSQQRKHTTYYEQRATLFDELPTSGKDIIFLGNSIIDGGEWSELFQNEHCKNRGISGDVCDGILDRLGTITKGRPAKVFLMIGINDLGRGGDPDTVAMKTRQIVKRIQAESPRTKIYIQSILPTNDHYGLFSGHTTRWRDIPVTNNLLQQVAEDEGVIYIDLFSLFADEEGKMDIKYSNDGLHLTGKGYLLWRDAVKRYL